MQSSNRDNFFQTDASQEQHARKTAKAGNKHGDPVSMSSKILAAVPDPASPSTSIFLAESRGYVKRVSIGSSEARTTYRGPKAPVTCVAVGGPNNKIVFAGSWDKDIWTWDVDSGSPGRKLSGHTDFVKTVVCAQLGKQHILLSGGADKKIMVWDIETGKRLHTLQDPTTTMLAVQHLAVDPVLSSESDDTIVFASASSDKHIRRWKVTPTSAEQLPESFTGSKAETERLTIEEHETSVYHLHYENTDEGGDVDLWTASADGTAKCLARASNFVADDSLEHGDYVQAVAVTEDWVVTAGRSEDVKVWDRTSGKLYCTLEGHFEEVTDLVPLRNPTTGRVDKMCSVSIDGTIRTWPLVKKELDEVVESIKAAAKPGQQQDGQASGEGMLTAEEEAELAELMDD